MTMGDIIVNEDGDVDDRYCHGFDRAADKN